MHRVVCLFTPQLFTSAYAWRDGQAELTWWLVTYHRVHTHVLLTLSSIIWYWPRGSSALGQEGRFGVAPALHHRLSALSTYRLSGLEREVSTPPRPRGAWHPLPSLNNLISRPGSLIFQPDQFTWAPKFQTLPSLFCRLCMSYFYYRFPKSKSSRLNHYGTDNITWNQLVILGQLNCICCWQKFSFWKLELRMSP